MKLSFLSSLIVNHCKSFKNKMLEVRESERERIEQRRGEKETHKLYIPLNEGNHKTSGMVPSEQGDHTGLHSEKVESMGVNLRDSKECFLKMKGKTLFRKSKYFVYNNRDKVHILAMRAPLDLIWV